MHREGHDVPVKTRSTAELWLGAFVGFYRPGVEEVRRLDAVSKFLYAAAPVPLSGIGWGEPATFLVWGPLMVGGGYAMITGDVSARAFYVSIPYGLGVMSILIGKHIDQMDFDASKGNRTLPVLLGERAARALNCATVILIYAVVVLLVALGQLTLFVAIVALTL